MSENELRGEIKNRLSEYRYLHTVGVVNAAKKLAKELLPNEEWEITSAAYLHDVAKELPAEELLELAKENTNLTAFDEASPQVLHAFAAPSVVRRDFPDLATEKVLSAVFKHTTGDKTMSLFDEIIFIADYVEEGREYPSCVRVRNELWKNLSVAKTIGDKESALHKAVLSAISDTVENLKKKERAINARTLLAEASIKEKIQETSYE